MSSNSTRVEDSSSDSLPVPQIAKKKKPVKSVFDRRRSGVLMHPTSIPGHCFNGVLGEEANKFLDFLSDSGFGVWQTLPLGPTGSDLSPYNSYSVFAINPRLIDPQWLLDKNYISAQPEFKVKTFKQEIAFRQQLLDDAWFGFNTNRDMADYQALLEFRQTQSYWIEDYALYCVIRTKQQGKHWKEWPANLLHRDPVALETFHRDHDQEIEKIIFEQFVVQRQWDELKQKATDKDILLFGDLPMYVAHDSADAWSQRSYFTINSEGLLDAVAGVPPDYFSETGQLWGNPLYNWQQMEKDNFDWWKHRLGRQLDLYDLVRIDHFRGFEAFWEIPGDAETALAGHWVKAPGDKLFTALREKFPELPVVAEDLGLITDEVTELRHSHHLPGMKVVQFGFDGKPENPHLPENYETDYVVYTGTHDNDTTLAWYNGLPDDAREYVDKLSGISAAQESNTTKDKNPTSQKQSSANETAQKTLDIKLETLRGFGEVPWPFICSAMSSRALYAIIPLQDLLSLGEGNRMNTPGTVDINWSWRYKAGALGDTIVNRMRSLNESTSRVV